MAEKTIAGSSGTAAGGNGEIDDMFSHLELNEDELDDVVIGAEKAKMYQDAARWLAIGKVLTNRNFSAEALFEKMKGIWNLSREPDCREAGENLFIFQMHCLGDWKKIHGIPELYRKLDVVDDLARKIGKVKEVQLAPKLFFDGNYVRIRVRINVEKCLMRFVSLTIPEGKKRLMVKYEKLPFFCKRCGFLGHDHEECGDGVWEEKQLQFGSWLLDVRRTTQPGPSPRQFAPKIPTRGGFNGRGGTYTGLARKRSSEEAYLDEEADLKDTDTSPMKTSLADLGTVGDGGRMEIPGAGQPALDGSSEVTMTDILAEPPLNSGIEPSGVIPPITSAYVDPRDRSKVRKSGENYKILAISAASESKDRRAQ
uniref:Uncharacterized protein n=1 Tax=Avena sativa TaxID=4498 RepID=A0ACD5UQD4_AVESA